MASDKYSYFERYPLWSAVGVVLFFVIVCLGGAYYSLEKCKSFFEIFPNKVNEWGDFLAGIFAPAALFFLALSVRIQSRELSAAVGAQKAMRDEMKFQVDQMKFAGMAPFYHDEINRLFDFLIKNEIEDSIKFIFEKLDSGSFDSGKLMSIFIENSMKMKEKEFKISDISEPDIFKNILNIMRFSGDIESYFGIYKELCGLYLLSNGAEGDSVFRRSKYSVLGIKIERLLKASMFVSIGAEYIQKAGSFSKK